MVFLMLSLVEPEPFITLNSNHEKQNSFSIESLQCTCFTVDIISIKSCKMLHVENNLANCKPNLEIFTNILFYGKHLKYQYFSFACMLSCFFLI